MSYLLALPILGHVFRAIQSHLQRRGPFNCALWPFFRCGHKVHTAFLNFRFKTVREELEKHFESGLERAAQVSVHWKGALVCDVFGLQNAADERAWKSFGADCVMVTFSVSKVLSAVIVSMLVGRGRLELDAPVRQYWPAFPFDIAVRDLLTHNAGLCWLSSQPPLADLTANSSQPAAANKLIAAIEAEAARVFPPSGRAYHTITWGLLVSELVRRVDESGRSVGALLDAWLATPLGCRGEISMGTASVTAAMQRRLVRHQRVPLVYRVLCVHLPKLLRAETRAFLRRAFYDMASPWNRSFALTKPWLTAPDLNQPHLQEVELAGSNAVASARALGRIAAALASGGRLEGKTIVEPSAMAALLERVDDGSMPYSDPVLFGLKLEWTSCGLGVLEMGAERGGRWYGWSGIGGSVMYFNPALELSYVYITSGLRDDADAELRHAPLMKAAVAAAIAASKAAKI